MARDWTTVEACTLPTAKQPLRVAEFDALFSRALSAVERPSDTQARLRLEGPLGLLEHVEGLAQRESACCSFFTFTVTREPTSAHGQPATDEAVQLDVEVPARHSDVLRALADRAAAAAHRAGRTS